jgi:ectoine hydroxylase-related dioxygenase (phytanoyl-CoA dioxygenase family)
VTRSVAQGTLSPESVDRFRKQGFLTRIPALSSREAASYRRALEDAESRELARRGGVWREREFRPETGGAHPLRDWFIELARHPKVLDAVESLIGPDIAVHSATVYIKEPGRSRVVPWHADVREPWPGDRQMVKAWIWLTQADLRNGCLRLLPGSHLKAAPHRQSNGTWSVPDDAIAALGPSVADEEDAGSILLHSMCLLHYSDTNRTDDRRIGYAVSYFSPKLAELGGKGEGFLARGECRYEGVRLTPEFPVGWFEV